jgi:hyperosmotically inducible protein
MNEQSSSSRKLIVAIGMAVIVGVAGVTFAVRVHRSTSVARTPTAPAGDLQAPDLAPLGAAPSDAAASVAESDRAHAIASDTAIPATADSQPAAIEPVSAGKGHVATAHAGGGTTSRTVAATGSVVDASESLSAPTAAGSMQGGQSADAPMTPSVAPSGMAADAAEAAVSAEPAASSMEPAASDNRITTAVKSEIAADGSSEDAKVGVTTTNGIVALTGTLASQEAIDHLKGVAEKVQDVKSVDTSELKIANT